MVSRVFSINTKCQILVYRSLFNRPNSPEQFLAHTRAESLEPKPRISRSTDIRAWTAVVMRTLRRFGLRNLPGHKVSLNADVRNTLVTVQTVPPEPGIIPVAVISVMGVPHDDIPEIKRTSDISVLKFHLAEAGELQKKRYRSSVRNAVNGRKWKSVVRFKLGGVDDVRKRDGAPVKHFGIGIVCDILLVHVPDIINIDILNTIAAVQQIRMDCGFLFQRQRNFFFGNSHVLCAVGVLVKLRKLSALRQYSVASGRKLGTARRTVSVPRQFRKCPPRYPNQRFPA